MITVWMLSVQQLNLVTRTHQCYAILKYCTVDLHSATAEQNLQQHLTLKNEEARSEACL